MMIVIATCTVPPTIDEAVLEGVSRPSQTDGATSRDGFSSALAEIDVEQPLMHSVV
jgi:hypothetical protein